MIREHGMFVMRLKEKGKAASLTPQTLDPTRCNFGQFVSGSRRWPSIEIGWKPLRDWMSRMVVEDNRQSLIVSGLTTLYVVCNTQQPEGTPLFVESKAKFACTTDCEPS